MTDVCDWRGIVKSVKLKKVILHKSLNVYVAQSLFLVIWGMYLSWICKYSCEFLIVYLQRFAKQQHLKYSTPGISNLVAPTYIEPTVQLHPDNKQQFILWTY